MRTGPFSSTEVISRLNASFVPVYAVNEDYRAGGSASKEEEAEYNRIRKELKTKLFGDDRTVAAAERSRGNAGRKL